MQVGSIFARWASSSTKLLSGENIEGMGNGAPVFQANTVADALRFNLLVGHVVIERLDTAQQQTLAIPDHSVVDACDLATVILRGAEMVWRDCGRNMP